jgi:stage II sporulation protein D
MALRARFLLAVALTASAYAPPLRVEAPLGAVRLPPALRVAVREAGASVIRRVSLEEYVEAVILSEFAPAAGDVQSVKRMFEVQAVISRTYAVSHAGRHGDEGFDVCSTTHCQLYEPARLRTSRWAPAARDAVRTTAGVVIWYGQAPATVLYHADCGGRTSDASSVWGGPSPPYLRGVPDDGPARDAHTAWTHEASHEAVRRALNAYPPTIVGAHLRGIDVLARDHAGRIQRLQLKGEREPIVRGEDFRTALTRAFGPRSIRSTRFNVRAVQSTFHFEGDGFGHGVGLCQTGAFAHARAGASLFNILRRYYPGTRLLAAR